MLKFLLWLILLVMCWPLALLALILYPLAWLLLLPFRLVGIPERLEQPVGGLPRVSFSSRAHPFGPRGQ